MSTKSHEIVVLFDTVAASRHAEKALEAAGFADPDVNTLDAAAIAKSAGAAKVGPWLWRRLFGEDVKLYEGAAYEKALAKGGAVLTVRIKGDEDAAKAEAILAKHNPVDLEARGAGIVAEHKALGTIPILNRPIKFPGAPQPIPTAPPALGEHTDVILGELLGLDDAAIAALRASKTVA